LEEAWFVNLLCNKQYLQAMGKVTSKAVFKSYDQQQILLLPPSLDELISSDHLVRVVNAVVDNLDLSALLNQYEGGGASSFHPRMMTKVLLYGYAMKIYTGRRLARALRQDVTFMWLAAGSHPDFRTINLFRTGILKDTIEDLFKQLLVFLIDHGYVKVENYFTDGSTFSADANDRKIVWRKNAERYKEMAERNCEALFKEIDVLNIEEDRQYGEDDLAETGTHRIDDESISKQVEKLNKIIRSTEEKRTARKAASLKKKVEGQQEKLDRYQQQMELSGQRSGYSKTDTDATAMYLKNDLLAPAYNVISSSENQFITGFSVHQNPNDASCFKEHVENLTFKPVTLTADSIFGTEQNYELLENYVIENYVKYPSFHREQTRSHKNNKFLKENFSHNTETDSYTCPNGRGLLYEKTVSVINKKTGYKTTSKVYKSENCQGCSMVNQCKKSTEQERTIHVNQQLDYHKQQARANLTSEKGLLLRKTRCIEIESCFGDIKHNMGFRRFHLRGKKKVKTEVGLVSMAHNLRKIQAQMIKKAT
jgi:transposase